MQCKVCGGETFKVLETPKRGINCDIRITVCAECGEQYRSSTVLEEIRDGEGYVAIKHARKLISDRQDAYMQNKIEKMQQLRNEQWKD